MSHKTCSETLLVVVGHLGEWDISPIVTYRPLKMQARKTLAREIYLAQGTCLAMKRSTVL